MNDILKALENVQNLSAAAMTFAASIICGYILRCIKKFPNDGIPLVVILTGCINMMVLADPRSSEVPIRIWITRHLIAGAIIGFIAWMSHKAVLSKLEDYLAQRFDIVARVLGIDKTTPPVDPPKVP